MKENDSNTQIEMESGNNKYTKLPFIAAGAIAITAVIIAAWFFLGRNDGKAGRPVSAPRMISVNEPGETSVSPAETITLSPEQLKAAGIEIEPIGEQLAAEIGLTAAAGRIEANAYRSVPATALVGGIVKEVRAGLGDYAKKGEILAIIFSNEFAEAQSRYISLKTEVENARANFERTGRLVAINQPGKSELDAAARQLKSAEAALTEMQNRFARTNRLIAIGAASREELDQDTTRLRTAEAELAEARSRYERALKLLEINPETKSQNEEAMNRLRTLQGELAAARQRLFLFGLDTSRIDALNDPGRISGDMPLFAPISGTITGRQVNPGEVIEANREILRVTDLSTVWVIAEVVERDLATLRIGGGANIYTETFPDRVFRGRITYIDPAIDEKTRTAKVRIEIANPGQTLRLGMYVNIGFAGLQKSERTVPTVSSSAVQEINGRSVIFLATSDPAKFEIRYVRVGNEKGGRVPIIEGANTGDRVVTKGAFLLRAEWAKLHQASAG